MGIGEWAALAAALMWTLSSMIWGKIHLSAMTLNLSKNVIGLVMIFLHIVCLTLFFGHAFLDVPFASWGWLAASGLIGIAIGDTLYFRSLQILGPRRALIMSTTSPLFAAVLAAAVLQEELKMLAYTGVCLTVLGVGFVVADRKARQEAPGLMPGRVSLGVAAGLAGAICQAIGGVLSKKGMLSEAGVEVCGPVEATFVRILMATIVTLIVSSLLGKIRANLRQACRREMLKLLIPATALGTWLGIWLSQVAYGHTDVAIAQTLLATCPLFAIPFVWIVHKHRVTGLSILGTMVALVGIILTVYDGK